MQAMKKTLCAFLASILLLMPLVSCDKPDEPITPADTKNTEEQESKYTPGSNYGDDETEATQNDKYDDEEIEVTQSSGNDNENTETQPNQNADVVELPEVYRVYPNLKEIGKFNQGLAPFIIQDSEGSKYGYIDTHGNVVIEPIYCTGTGWGGSPYSEISLIPTFEKNNYISANTNPKQKYNSQKIYDSNGNIVFSAMGLLNNISQISYCQNGYFAVETVTEELIGLVYSITFYSAYDLSEIVSFENARLSDGLSNIDENGNAEILTLNSDAYSYSYQKINISDYDSNFKSNESTWAVDVESIESFQGVDSYYRSSTIHNDIGQIASVILVNRSNIYYYATVDNTGNVLMEPRKDIAFSIDYVGNDPFPLYNYCLNLCPAQDIASGLWGYIDPYGNWKIQPQYISACDFSVDGYATVDNNIVIDTTGNVVLSPNMIREEDIYGTYTRGDYKIIIEPNEEFTLRGAASIKYGQYNLQSNNIIVTGIGQTGIMALNPHSTYQDGTYPIQKTPTGLVINGLEWTRVVYFFSPPPLRGVGNFSLFLNNPSPLDKILTVRYNRSIDITFTEVYYENLP